MKNIKGDLIINTLSSQMAEISADIIGAIVFFKIGAKRSLFTAYLIGALGSLGLIFARGDGSEGSGNEGLISFMVGVAKFGI